MFQGICLYLKRTFASRLSLRIMAVLIVIMAIIMAVVYLITKDSMAHEAEARYEGIILHTNEKIRGVLSDVYVAAINNVNVIERDLNDSDLLQQHLERAAASGADGQPEPIHVELPTDLRVRLLPPERP